MSRGEPEQSGEGRSAPGFLTTLKWSCVTLAVTLVVAAISIPVLRWFGVD